MLVLIFALGFEFWFHRKNLKVFCFFLLVGVSDTGIGLFLEVIGKASPLMIPESTATWRMGLGHFFHVSSVFIRPVFLPVKCLQVPGILTLFLCVVACSAVPERICSNRWFAYLSVSCCLWETGLDLVGDPFCLWQARALCSPSLPLPWGRVGFWGLCPCRRPPLWARSWVRLCCRPKDQCSEPGYLPVHALEASAQQVAPSAFSAVTPPPEEGRAARAGQGTMLVPQLQGDNGGQCSGSRVQPVTAGERGTALTTFTPKR